MAYEAWCTENGEGTLSQNMFSRVIGERGVVKKFEEGKSNKVRIWKGIGLQKSVPPSPPSEKVSRDKSPANVGVVKDNGTLSEDFQNFSTEPPTREYFSENGKKCPSMKKVSLIASPPPSVDGGRSGVGVHTSRGE